MHPYLMQEMARQRVENLCRAARQNGPARVPQPPPGDRGKNNPTLEANLCDLNP